MTTNLKSFQDFGVEPSIDEALADAGITTPFPIQELTLPLALMGADIIGQARTGTGKTLAFGIPLLARANPDVAGVQGLVIVPTRELCLQVTGDLNQAGVRKGVDVVAIYGGRAIEPQVEAIRSGASIVVGTPGRLLDLVRRGDLGLSGVTALVLDEADEMLDLGFLPDVEQLIESTAPDRQTLLFSATMPAAVVALARRYMRKPTFLRTDVEEVHIAPETTQYFFSCHRLDKPSVLARILQSPNRGRCLVFTRTKRMADILAEELRGRGIAAAPIHSDLRQEAREKALARFRDGRVDVLVATEVAARGLDITDVTHVVNYDCPDDEKMYLHRVGRTGRAGAAGVAITLVMWNELARLEMIKRALDITDETHEVYSTSPILDELFDLPPRAPRTAVVVVDEEEAVAQPEQRGQGGRRRSRRRGGRGPEQIPAAAVGRRGPEQTPVAAEARRGLDQAAVAADVEPEPVAESEPAGEPPARRRRRSIFRRGRAETSQSDQAAQPTPAPAADEEPPAAEDQAAPAAVAEAPPAEADEAGEAGSPDRRVRVRRRTARGTPSGERSEQPADDAPRTRQPERVRRGGSAQREATPRRTSEARRPAGSRTRRDGERSRSASPARSRRQDPTPPVDAATARGTGKPTIARPLVIAHLP